MQPKTIIPVTLLALGALAMGGCSAFDNLGGGKKVSPDEFKIVSHSPLTMPPNAELRPPRPGEPRPQEVTPSEQAREALAPQTAGRPQRGAGANANAPANPGGASEQALVAKAGQGGIDPNIRSRVNTDTRTINDSDKSFVDSLIFWQDAPPTGVVLDPAKEQQRLRDAQAAGQTPAGATPTITRRKRGLLEGIF
ncbi:MAG: DUF3035 domain-containing protein [Reyranella sp.]|nr:DUF3035 domain-containing protein [Reyranella sp.]